MSQNKLNLSTLEKQRELYCASVGTKDPTYQKENLSSDQIRPAYAATVRNFMPFLMKRMNLQERRRVLSGLRK